ncbi:histidine phosphatase family protein [Streptomyces sp. S1D4-11]|nr:histidine phosphatase family protein [Streptomyces sp. S1D4-11]QIY94496.1 histidine phosphatase family protein [Streptomyces sp. S1D4-11]
MTTYLLRHARTAYSARYLVNGDPALPLPLDDEGIRACRTARATLPADIRTWAVSTFPRTQQTARLLSTDPALSPTVLPQLDELDYGAFEGGPFLEYAGWLQQHGPWARPPGAAESQREGIRCLLLGVRAALELPGPRVLIAHGLLLSVLGWASARTPDTPVPLFFPEAQCLAPLVHTDDHLAERTAALLAELDLQDRSWEPTPGDALKTSADDLPDLATVGVPSITSEEQSPHA